MSDILATLPLSAIRIFEAAARLKSFTRAADELGVTQAAVSWQVKALEQRLGQPLFIRLPREVTLTPGGERLSRAATEAMRCCAPPCSIWSTPRRACCRSPRSRASAPNG